MIKINKELQRPDGGNVAAGSIVDYNTKFIGKERIALFDLKLYFNQQAIDDEKTTVPSVDDFKYRLNKECTAEEWIAVMTQPNAGALTQDWLKELIDLEIGQGFTEIV